VRVHVDHTGPEVWVEGLRGRWDTDGLYVHNSTDLSTMRLVLTAQDTHSGLATLQWKLGTRPLANDVGEGAVSVERLQNSVRALFCFFFCVGPSVWSFVSSFVCSFAHSFVRSHTYISDVP
jgi:hypothetical protein